MQLPQGNPKLPDDINNKDQKPLLDFLLLAAGVVAGLLLLSVVLLKSAQWLAPHVPYQWERDWFASPPETEEDSASNAATSKDQTADQASNYTKEQALNALMSRLLAGQAAPLPVTLHWLEEDMPNAFATVGGHIFVTSGLLQQVSSENALAMVLAHEYAHVKLRHPITLVAEQLSLTTLNLLIGNSSASALTQQGGWHCCPTAAIWSVPPTEWRWIYCSTTMAIPKAPLNSSIICSLSRPRAPGRKCSRPTQ